MVIAPGAPLTLEVIATSLLIVAARIGDVSLGTIRTVSVINGRRGVAWALGFIEVLIWILVVSRVINEVRDNTFYAIAYALGFAMGNFVGITIEQHLAYGEQVIRVFSRSEGLAHRLRGHGHRVTEFEGRGRDGAVSMLFIQTPRKRVSDVLTVARSMDPECYYVVDDIRLAASGATPPHRSRAWRSLLKGK
jgi:uncharacterized protein YebE (UPF0316 family)